MAHKRVLIIDDEEAIQEVVQLSLELETDWEILTASSGENGIAKATSEQPDAILLDIMMPAMDGIATLARLRNHSQTYEIPVIFLTAKSQASERRHFNAMGVAGVIVKPFNSLTLADQISDLLGWQEIR